MDEQTPRPELHSSAVPSIHRSFVVRLYGGLDDADDRICGLAEHMVSGLASEFQSVDELVRFMRRVAATSGRART
jgi:hypothetical protein